MSTVTIQPNQSLFDIAIQECGTITAALPLCLLNDISVTGDLVKGEVLQTNVSEKRIEIQSFYKKNELKPASALSAADLFNSNPTGIDYMIIETDFIVK